MQNQTILFAAVCAICFLFYRCNTATNTSANTDSSSTTKAVYAGFGTCRRCTLIYCKTAKTNI